MPNCAEGTICSDLRSLLYTSGGSGGGGAVSRLAGPGQGTGGSEAPGSSEKICILQLQKEAKKHLCGAFFLVS